MVRIRCSRSGRSFQWASTDSMSRVCSTCGSSSPIMSERLAGSSWPYSDVSSLHQVLDRLGAVPVALHAAADQGLIADDEHLTRGLLQPIVSVICPYQGEQFAVVALGQRHAGCGGDGCHCCLRMQGIDGR